MHQGKGPIKYCLQKSTAVNEILIGLLKFLIVSNLSSLFSNPAEN